MPLRTNDRIAVEIATTPTVVAVRPSVEGIEARPCIGAGYRRAGG
jgi:hypothetical protein